MPTCTSCGRGVDDELAFCPWCGSKIPAGLERLLDPETSAQLDASMERYVSLVRDLDEGRLTPDDFLRQAFRVGLVVRDRDVWLLDVKGGSWWRYDGFALEPVLGRMASLPTADSTSGPE